MHVKARASSGALLALAACSGPPSIDTGGPDSEPEIGDSRFTVSGVVEDLDGDPVVDVFVTVSTELCIPDRTNRSAPSPWARWTQATSA